LANLPPSPANDLIRQGHALIVDTATNIGKNATDPQRRYAGNDLAPA
jgi:cytochrome c